MTETLSLPQARKLILHSQHLPPAKSKGRAIDATLSVIERLGYIQIDTISAIQRAHHHTLWNRNPGYQPEQLDKLLLSGQVFEYWSHAASYLPMRDYRFSLPRKQAIASSEQNHWYRPEPKLVQQVLDRIRIDGPLMARDFEQAAKSNAKPGDWNSKPAKQALETLFMQGELMVAHRSNFHKVYDLTERVLPAGVDTRLPDPETHERFLIRRYLEANGLGRASEIAYLLKNIKSRINDRVQQMLSDGELLSLQVGGLPYVALPDALSLLDKPLARSKLKILSPFDNLLIQRQRTLALFGFDYQIECYLPAAKRRFGYFSLPILWSGKLVARMDCKAERREGRLHIRHLALEPGLKQLDGFAAALAKELRRFVAFNQCHQLVLHRTSPSSAHRLINSGLFPLVD
ncbi:winged helix-turn-helix domain-containing protein [Motiliproteus coralliicola]|uniref:Winged helix-turn-helix domain-containing protein n=1 Tax=Motiliproteus coralliicola TaxID=2283196 RepID=A0A369W958_9GAMM|nr:crosslink repair DNA glycosylase YcaQ family protein [Motiliproteus coralliicola]RDE18432.1 winged helix-turn-helix domain-containing protein [Motiliproteus coralliicola]